MQHKSWFSILFDTAILILMMWASIHYLNKLGAAKEEIEVLRNGFLSVVSVMSLIGVVIVSRMEDK